MITPDAGAAPAATATRYDASSIVVLSDLEAVRRNPGMYVGSSGGEGVHHLAFELLDNAVDEFAAGHGTAVEVVLHADGALSVRDDGRGIPVDPHPATGGPTAEVLLTTLHSGGKFNGDVYRTSAGLHGVGLAAVNALSAWLRLDVWRDGGHFHQSFRQGVADGPAQQAAAGPDHGTRITFLPDFTVMAATPFAPDVLLPRLEEIAFLNPGLTVTFRDDRDGRTETLRGSGGVRALLMHRYAAATTVHAEPVEIAREDGDLLLTAAVRWTEAYTEGISAFVNTIRTAAGGAHVDGLRTGLVAAVNQHIARHGLTDRATADRITAMDVLEGLTAAVAIRMERPEFDGQTKQRLQSERVNRFVAEAVEQATLRRFADDPELARAVVNRILDSTRARSAARLAGRTARFQRRAVDIDYSVYQRQFGIRSQNWHDSCSWLTDAELLGRHAALCEVPAGARMLDVCCGSGVVGDAFRGKVGEMIGLDITPEMVRLASQRLDRVYQGTVYDLPFDDASFDLVVNREVLHLLPQPERPLAEIYRVLRPGGQFIVGQIMPYGDEDAFWMFRIFKKKQPLLAQMFREEDFRRLLLGAGFTGLRTDEYFLWESIDRWIDTHETTPTHRRQIYRLFYDAPAQVRAVHPFEVAADGSVRDRWRWCVYSLRKPLA
ncbi:methyltransferase domain-containing protein [Mangrovihabitans endophyticus]|uniref:DNA topoisomerase (ATP-hydrolyzing) n=1 Tax=Mangrovihabitans endophyticus TaxID=1751298 RepID=A0A8J3FNC2_9ACTN|nr:methyltransferase domain-containing protein [Mangrovihabitans endophyticus]GGK90984.1 hypothetical protein GCM10012284_26040 [Mangrovihabitans endophyticus]